MYISPNLPVLSNTNFLLKPGQIVRGKVLRYLDGGKILTQVQNSTIVAETDIQVSEGELLLMYVKSLTPKPHLQVIRRVGKKINGSKQTKSSQKLLNTILKENLPISRELLNDLLSTANSVSSATQDAVLASLEKNPAFWQRLLWQMQISTLDELLLAIEWEQSASELQNLNIATLDNFVFEANYSTQKSITKVQTLELFLEQLTALTKVEVVSDSFIQRHINFLNAFQSLPWENSEWAGWLLPMMFADTRGLLLGSLWREHSAHRSDRPVQLSLLGSLETLGIFSAKFEYRTSDFAGVLEVSNPEFYRLLDDDRQFFHGRMSRSGYQHLAFQINYVPNLVIDYSKLLPGVPVSQKIKV